MAENAVPRETPLILVSDDDSTIRALLTLALSEAGYSVEVATTGEEGLAKYLRLQPDLVLLDAIMPEMDGFTCCQQIRSLPGGTQIPILMITFLDDRDSIEQAFESGATDYITKPIHWSVLRQRVKHLLLMSRLMQQSGQQLQAPVQAPVQPKEQDWEQWFRTLLSQVSSALPASEKQASKEQTWIKVLLPSIATPIITQIAAQIQTFFDVERVVIYPLEPSYAPSAPSYVPASVGSPDACSLNFSVEVVAPGYPALNVLKGLSLNDLGFVTRYALQYQRGEPIVIENVAESELPLGLREQLMTLKTPSMAIVPIGAGQGLWGLLCLHRSDRDDPWESLTLDRLADVARLLGLVVKILCI